MPGLIHTDTSTRYLFAELIQESALECGHNHSDELTMYLIELLDTFTSLEKSRSACFLPAPRADKPLAGCLLRATTIEYTSYDRFVELQTVGKTALYVLGFIFPFWERKKQMCPPEYYRHLASAAFGSLADSMLTALYGELAKSILDAERTISLVAIKCKERGTYSEQLQAREASERLMRNLPRIERQQHIAVTEEPVM